MIMQMQYLSHDIVLVAAGGIYALPERDRDDGPIACKLGIRAREEDPYLWLKRLRLGTGLTGQKLESRAGPGLEPWLSVVRG